MPCPFATTFQIVYGNLGDVIALTATAPLYRIATIKQTQSQIPIPTSYSSSLWQGNLLTIGYSIGFKYTSIYLNGYILKKLTSSSSSSSSSEEEAAQKKKDDDTDDKAKKQQKQQRFLRNTQLAGVVASCATIFLLYPIQYTLTNILAGGTGGGGGGGGAGAGDSKQSVPFFDGSLQDAVLTTIQKVGIISLYQGVSMMIMNCLHQQSISFYLHQRLLGGGKYINWKKRFLINQIIGCLATFISYPMETISRHYQIQTGNAALLGKNNDVTSSTATSMTPPLSLSSSEDIIKMYSGITLTLARTILYNGILTVYNSEYCQDIFRRIVMKFFH